MKKLKCYFLFGIVICFNCLLFSCGSSSTPAGYVVNGVVSQKIMQTKKQRELKKLAKEKKLQQELINQQKVIN